MKTAIALASVLALASPALADDTKEGWGFQFRQDTFEKALFPLAMMSEDGDGFDKALVAFACGSDGKLVAFFQPERFMMFAEASKVQFRAGDITNDFTFSVGDVPHLGKRLIVDTAKSDELAQIFASAAGGEVPFRTDKKQGVFTSIGAAETFTIVRGHCPK